MEHFNDDEPAELPELIKRASRLLDESGYEWSPTTKANVVRLAAELSEFASTIRD